MKIDGTAQRFCQMPSAIAVQQLFLGDFQVTSWSVNGRHIFCHGHINLERNYHGQSMPVSEIIPVAD
jgi:hypothetical protein